MSKITTPAYFAQVRKHTNSIVCGVRYMQSTPEVDAADFHAFMDGLYKRWCTGVRALGYFLIVDNEQKQDLLVVYRTLSRFWVDEEAASLENLMSVDLSGYDIPDDELSVSTWWKKPSPITDANTPPCLSEVSVVYVLRGVPDAMEHRMHHTPRKLSQERNMYGHCARIGFAAT